MMWKDSYRLGVESIDQQHIELFRMTEALVNAVKEEAPAETCKEVLEFLKDYVIYHFKDEEAYQASIHYSGIEAHKAEHRQFTQTVLEYEKCLKENGFDRKTMKDLAGTVTVWLIYHVVDTDQKIVAGEEYTSRETSFHKNIDVFANSALEIMETMAGLDRSKVQQQTTSLYHSKGDISITIELVGDLKGKVVFGFSKELALYLIQTMTMMELRTLDELVRSALCELTNITCGNATVALAKHGLHCDIRPPVASQGGDYNIDGTGVRIDTAFGCLEVGVQIENPEKQAIS